MSARSPKSFPRRGPVLASAVRVDVRVTDGQDITKGFQTWGDACAWLASLAGRAPSITTVRIIHQAAQAGDGQ